MKKEKTIDPMRAVAEELFSGIKDPSEFHSLFNKLLKQGIEVMLQAEINDHLQHSKNDKSPDGNLRNGSSKKTVKSKLGDIALNIPRDRNSTFSPFVVPKHERMIDTIEDTIIGLYARGMNTRDIEDQIKEIYQIEVSPSTISNVTANVIEYMRQWQNRPLESIYLITWMDAISIKVREHGKINNKSIFLIIGLNREGQKEVLGMWINESESASFWMSVLTDLKARGVEDIGITCTDNLKGFTEAIRAVYPQSINQLCIVHQIRNSLKYVVYTDKKEVVSDLKKIYQSINLEQAKIEFEKFKLKWNKKYAYAVRSWETNWNELTAYFEYPLEIRKMIYTTNVIESLNSTIRKYIKTRTVFPNDAAALKSVYLAINIIEKKWTKLFRNWSIIIQQFSIIFGDRFKLLN